MMKAREFTSRLLIGIARLVTSLRVPPERNRLVSSRFLIGGPFKSW